MGSLNSKLVLPAIFIGGLILCGACSRPEPKPAGIFSSLNTHPDLKNIFNISEAQPGSFDMTFNFWQQVLKDNEYEPYFSLAGRLEVANQTLRLESEKLVDHFVLFDFSLKNHASRRISIVRRLGPGGAEHIQKTEHMLALDTSFTDLALADTIFKFRLARVLKNESDLVFFIGKRSGAQGIYHARVFMNENAIAQEEIYSSRGNVYNDRKIQGRNVRFVRNEGAMPEKF